MQTSLTVGLCVASASHTLSLLSSSFVEEEHQTWYFLTVTMWLVVAVHQMMRRLQHVNHCSSQFSDQTALKKRPSSGCLIVTAVVNVHRTVVVTLQIDMQTADVFVFIFIYLFSLNSVKQSNKK